MGKNKYFKIDGDSYKVDVYTVIDEAGKVELDVWKNGNYHGYHYLKAYYRPERTLDDHMGNTPCGYYVNVPVYTKWGKTRVRFYF